MNQIKIDAAKINVPAFFKYRMLRSHIWIAILRNVGK